MPDRKIIVKLMRLGVPQTKIAEHLSISRKTLYRYLKKNPISADELDQVIEELIQPAQDQHKAKREQIKSENEGIKNESYDKSLPENWREMSPKERREYLDKNILDGDMQKILK